MSELITAEEMTALAEVAEAGMQTPVEVYRPAIDNESDANYGMDKVIGDPTADPDAVPVWTGLGWFYSQLQSRMDATTDQIATTGLLELRLPLTATIANGDIVKNTNTGTFYHVIDTSTEDTYQPMLEAIVRLRE